MFVWNDLNEIRYQVGHRMCWLSILFKFLKMVWLDLKSYSLFDSPLLLNLFPFLIPIWLIHRHRMEYISSVRLWKIDRICKDFSYLYLSWENLHHIFIPNGSIGKLFSGFILVIDMLERLNQTTLRIDKYGNEYTRYTYYWFLMFWSNIVLHNRKRDGWKMKPDEKKRMTSKKPNRNILCKFANIADDMCCLTTQCIKLKQNKK